MPSEVRCLFHDFCTAFSAVYQSSISAGSPMPPPVCRSQRSAYSPPASISRLWMPSSTISPFRRTTIRSRLATVDRRWAITIEVRPFIRFCRAAWISCSLSESRALVASSSTRMGASVRIARAMAILWRYPPESFTPRSPVIVSNPSGSRSMNSRALASAAACRISSGVASGRPYAIFSEIVLWNRSGSWGT